MTDFPGPRQGGNNEQNSFKSLASWSLSFGGGWFFQKVIGIVENNLGWVIVEWWWKRETSVDKIIRKVHLRRWHLSWYLSDKRKPAVQSAGNCIAGRGNSRCKVPEAWMGSAYSRNEKKSREVWAQVAPGITVVMRLGGRQRGTRSFRVSLSTFLAISQDEKLPWSPLNPDFRIGSWRSKGETKGLKASLATRCLPASPQLHNILN